MRKILIKRLSPEAQVPSKTYEEDFCYDCVAVSCEEIHPGVFKYGLGIALQPLSPYDGSEIRGFQVRPRSSIHKTGMVLSNSFGTIDENYTGEISAVFYHVVKTLPRYQVGDKVCQLCLDKTEPLDFVEVKELRTTNRASRGYGSTGLKQNTLNT